MGQGRGWVLSKLFPDVSQFHWRVPPRGTGVVGDYVNLLLAYLLLAKSLREDRIDDLALRSLLQLEDNGIGGERLWAVTELALERRVRFSEAITHIERNPADYRGSRLGAVVAEYDRLVNHARSMAQDDDEDLLTWVRRVGEAVGLDASARDLMNDLAQQIELELADDTVEPPPVVEVGSSVNLSLEPRARDFLAELLSAMTNLGETLPTRLADHVTLTTMHGAKGLSADIVFALQIEDELVPGQAAGIELDEARRLLYVTLTRARKRLVVGACQRRTGPQRFAGSREVVDRTLSSFIRDYGLVAETVAEYLSRL